MSETHVSHAGEGTVRRFGSALYALGLGLVWGLPLLPGLPFGERFVLNPFVSWGACAIFLGVVLIGVARGETVLPAAADGRRPALAWVALVLVCLALPVVALFGLVLSSGGSEGAAFLLIFIFPLATAAAFLAAGAGVGLAELARIGIPIHARSAERTLLVALFTAAGFALVGDNIEQARVSLSLISHGVSLSHPSIGAYWFLRASEFVTGALLLVAAVCLLRRAPRLARPLGFTAVLLALGLTSFVLIDDAIAILRGAHWTLGTEVRVWLAPVPWVLAGIGLRRCLRAAEGS